MNERNQTVNDLNSKANYNMQLAENFRQQLKNLGERYNNLVNERNSTVLNLTNQLNNSERAKNFNNILFNQMINELQQTKTISDVKNSTISILQNQLEQTKRLSEQQKIENDSLKSRLNDVNSINFGYFNEINDLKKQLKQKEEEIKIIKEQKNSINYNTSQNQYFSQIGNSDRIYLKFNSTDHRINISCSKNDLFSSVEKKLYQKYPDLRDKENQFLSHGNKVVIKDKTIQENGLKSESPILLIQIDKSEIFSNMSTRTNNNSQILNNTFSTTSQTYDFNNFEDINIINNYNGLSMNNSININNNNIIPETPIIITDFTNQENYNNFVI